VPEGERTKPEEIPIPHLLGWLSLYDRWPGDGFGGWSGRRESNPRFELGKLSFCH
jgi:hypothetical protein